MPISSTQQQYSIQWAVIILFSLFSTARPDDPRLILPGAPPEIVVIRVREDSPFKIALFGGLHFGEDSWTDWGPCQDVDSARVMSTVLEKEEPDFVVYLGDIITANNIMIENASLYWDEAVSPTRARGIPWARVFGNHDDAPFEWPMDWLDSESSLS